MQESQSDSDGQHSNIHEDEIACNVEEGLKSGMHFPTMDNLVNFYKEHARLKGFSIVIRSSCKGNGLVPKYVLMTCDKGNKPHGGKYTKRVNCPARINGTLKDNGLWVVGRVITNHIHQLDPSMSRFMAYHRYLSNGVKRSLEANDIVGIRPFKSIRLLEVQFGGSEKMGYLPKDCRNFIYNRRRLRLDEGDAESIRKLFSRLQVIERTFFYVIDVDWECRLRNILWVHPQGCALLSHEDVETFKWVFSTWLSAMGDTHPHVILTDQCESIRAAIREVMPETRHRFCLWHILSKLSEKFKGVEDFTKVNLSEWNDGLLASAVGSENVGIANSDSSVAILNPREARSRGRPRSNRFHSRRELNGGSNRGRSRGRRGRRGRGTSENAHGYLGTSINHSGDGMQMSQHQSIARIASALSFFNLLASIMGS
ncbi:hypothetical protein GH714_030396 [Hevea brasiliensis]|uniref:MULE transposase domain-containing protein n=1 Tax=Hevea brasiliensis TaxID=3981 RepID=A0A6A6NCS9_HEVBR|nr:hypothetical protein GH714_030396 [Hevea brasiliensis]